MAGYYGYMRADGQPVRVKYGAVDNLGFSAIEEMIPVTFPPATTTEISVEITEGSGGSPSEPPVTTDAPVTTELPSLADESFIVEISEDEKILVLPKQPIVDDEKESVSIDASDYFRSGDFLPVVQEPENNNDRRFEFPFIDVPDLPRRRHKRALIPEPSPLLSPTIPVLEDRSDVVIEQLPGEPAIIFKQPKRFHKVTGTRFSTHN